MKVNIEKIAKIIETCILFFFFALFFIGLGYAWRMAQEVKQDRYREGAKAVIRIIKEEAKKGNFTIEIDEENLSIKNSRVEVLNE